MKESKKAILSAGNVSVISLNEDKPLVAEEGALYSNKVVRTMEFPQRKFLKIGLDGSFDLSFTYRKLKMHSKSSWNLSMLHQTGLGSRYAFYQEELLYQN
jgi:hypothetical protein